MKGTQKSAKSTTATKKSAEAFTDEERAAIKERVRETKAAANKVDGDRAVLEKIAEMREPDRALGKRLHTVIKASAPSLSPTLWYGMPAYAKDGKMICFFQPAQKFKTRRSASATRRTSTKALSGRTRSP
jgi:uncharacterized protein YdhG (YjbR/CyaY superfamily)